MEILRSPMIPPMHALGAAAQNALRCTALGAAQESGDAGRDSAKTVALPHSAPASLGG